VQFDQFHLLCSLLFVEWGELGVEGRRPKR